MRLHRSTPPTDDGWTVIDIGSDDGPVLLSMEPRAIGWDKDAHPVAEFMHAFDRACGRIFGQHWQGSLELVCDLRKGTARKWMKDSQIPPPMIVAWIAYLSAREDARSIGRMLEGMALGGNVMSLIEARAALIGLRA